MSIWFSAVSVRRDIIQAQSERHACFFPSFSLLFPVVEHCDLTERFFRDRWLAHRQAGQEEECLLDIRCEHRQAEDLRNAWLADVANGGEVLEVANFAGS